MRHRGIGQRAIQLGLWFRWVATGALLWSTVGPHDASAQAPAATNRSRSVRALDTVSERTGADTVLSLGALYASVDRDNPRLRAAAALARAATARVPGATKPPDPQLQLGLMNYSLPRLAPDATLGMRQLQLMQMVPLPGKLAAAGDAARARAQAVGARVGDIRWELRAATAMAFYELWAAAARIELARATRRLLEDVAAVATAMYRVGDGRQSDVLRARVEIARMDEDIVRMQAMAEAARARLAAATSLPEDELDRPTVLPVFPDSIPARAELAEHALRTRSMLAAGEAEVRAAVADERLARRDRWPDVQVGVQYGERAMPMGIDRMGSLMVGASLPVFANARQLRMRDEAAAMRAMSEADLKAMQLDTRARVFEVHAELTRARRLTALYQTTILPQAEAAAASALASYRAGAVDFMTVLENRMTVNRYREELVTLTAAEGQAWADLEMLLTRPLLAPEGSRR